MFARMVEINFQPEKQQELLQLANTELLPLVLRQPGGKDVTALLSDTDPGKAISVVFWNTRQDAERFYASAEFDRWQQRVRPFLLREPVIKTYDVATSTFHHISATRAA
jgi:heme-degrading monooxygenase HmoA